MPMYFGKHLSLTNYFPDTMLFGVVMKKLILLVSFLSVGFTGSLAAGESELSYRNVAVSYIAGDADGFGLRGSIGFADSWFVSLEYNDRSQEASLPGTTLAAGIPGIPPGIIGLPGATPGLIAQPGVPMVLGAVNIETDSEEVALDIGYHWSLGDRTDLVTSIGYSRVEVEVTVINLGGTPIQIPGFNFNAGNSGEFSSSASGFDVNFGVRGKPVEQFEYGVFVTYYNGGDFNSDVQLSGEARYHFSAPVSVGVKYRNSDDFDYWGVDVRYDF